MRVGHQHAAVARDRDAGRAAVLVHGGLPAAEELAIGGEDLDAGGHVDQIKMVVGVDGHRPRLLQSAIGNATPPPDHVEPAERRFVFDAPAKSDGKETEA